ncbi:MAG: sigma-70 family RNA polymerase sigma factor [Phycisphaerales bacterium]|nr:MAG: sigma-70 family RNA polymerase sigma factor [Phycisphaerales bacterium]
MAESSEQSVSHQLAAARQGDQQAIGALFRLLYDDLRMMAARYMQQERAAHTLQATALVHEAYLRLVDRQVANWQDRAHFLAVAAQAIRRVLVDHARGRGRKKRGGGHKEITLSTSMAIAGGQNVDLLALDEALNHLSETDPLEAHIVEMRFFAELTVEEIAEVLGISDRSVRRHWNYAKTWLYRELRKGETRAERGERP